MKECIRCGGEGGVRLCETFCCGCQGFGEGRVLTVDVETFPGVSCDWGAKAFTAP